MIKVIKPGSSVVAKGKFYHYRQNNSGGAFEFDHDKGISVNVIIQASSAEEADEKAGEIGLYFDGVESGRDCGCCGDRWGGCCGPGEQLPSIYSAPVEEYYLASDGSRPYRWTPKGEADCYVHYSDGSVVGYGYGE